VGREGAKWWRDSDGLTLNQFGGDGLTLNQFRFSRGQDTLRAENGLITQP
jgi:hypothetical protein